ncbi:gamma-glutamylcyclotransferase [Stieleria sp. JC731]|uniref:gamma-glutamylcyclotransferase family protein n=1 Tax=Pirellulaceae TaxID=2691357 RepID=UPI001E2A4FF4|nr:gamma-glutamylcyclotransferase family protein [Stieleria sp. JC731]MCC9603600.1 gamma-glutamylcyclotransferase [Stieleria sp. JC731]
MDSTESICQVFVYGTLKRGQCREKAWPAKPLSVDPAVVRAALFGRDDYPAMTTGDNLVLGEVWSFLPEQMPVVMEVLDEIEGTSANSENDLYHRHLIEALIPHHGSGKRQVSAYTYFYNRDLILDGFQPQPLIDGVQSWPTAR